MINTLIETQNTDIKEWVKYARVGQWVSYNGYWWKIIKKYDWIWQDDSNNLILRRCSKNLIRYLGV